MMKKYIFGIDIGATTIKSGLFTSDGELLEKWEIPTMTEGGPNAVLPNISASIMGKCDEREIDRENIVGVGVGAPGSMNDEGVIFGAVNIGWKEMNLNKELGDLLKLPVRASNDANVAALGEIWQGAGKGYSNAVMVTLGTGVGGGIIINGRILTGATGGGGEIGHIHVDDTEFEPCNCGNKGCLEQYASASGIVRLARRRLAEDDSKSILKNSGLSAKSVFDALKAGDETAGRIVEEFGEYLGKGLAIVASVVNPQAFIIGGGVSKAGDILIKYIEPAFKKYAFPPCANAEFTIARLGNDAGIYGAAALVLNEESE